MRQFALGNFVTALFTLALLIGSAGAQESSKQIHVSDKASPIEVQVSTSKTSYQVNEPIVFRVTLNQDAYVYLFNIPDNSPTALQLFPNAHEGGQPLIANKEVLIPGKSTFRSDRAGTEKVVLVASSQPLTLSNAKTMGEFTAVAHEEVNTLVKQIRVDTPAAPNRLVKQMEVIIRDKESQPDNTQRTPMPVPPSTRGSRVAALITTDKIMYGATENVTITYGADAKGYVAIYLLNPNKQITLLKESAVARNKTYKLRAQAIPPTGEHVLLVLFNTKAKPARHREEFVSQLLTPEQVGKNLRPIAEAPEAYTVYRFTTQ